MPIRSAGIIMFHEEENREYLLLHYTASHWDLPKGHIEKGETSTEAALRELQEETGISQVELLPDFKETISYRYKEKGKLVLKFVVFFLGKTKVKKVSLSHEHKEFEWLPFDEAYEKVTFPTAKKVLKAAEDWLNEKS